MYLGTQPTSAAYVTDTFSGTGSQTDFSMSVAPASTSSMLVVISGVMQDPSTYAIVGMTLRFSAAPPSGTGNISVRYLGIPASGVVNTAYRTVTDFTATAGQTTWTVPSYTPGFIDVFRNGVRLGNTDFTATSGTSIVLAVGANANDLITTVSFSVSSVLNAIPNTAGSVSALNLAPGAARANFGAGTVLQVVQGVNGTKVETSSGTYVNTGLTASITPMSASSKILVRAVFTGQTDDRNTPSNWEATCYFGLARNSTGISENQLLVGTSSETRQQTLVVPVTLECLDSPNTTSSVSYTVQVRATTSAYYAIYSPYSTNGYITLMEIAA